MYTTKPAKVDGILVGDIVVDRDDVGAPPDTVMFYRVESISVTGRLNLRELVYGGRHLSDVAEDNVVVFRPKTGAAIGPKTDAPAKNPKTAVGAVKAPLALVSPVACALEAEAMAEGARKYGAFNFRKSRVPMMTYLHALKRHVDALLDGEDMVPDGFDEVTVDGETSLVAVGGTTHIGNARACLGIIADAQAIGMLDDDRPPKGGAARTHAEIHARAKARLAAEKAKK